MSDGTDHMTRRREGAEWGRGRKYSVIPGKSVSKYLGIEVSK